VKGLANLAALALAACAPAGTSAPAADPAASPPGTAPSVLGPWISFHAGFEGELGAELAVGRPEPSRVQGAPVYDDGVHGRAVGIGVSEGGLRLEYPLAGNLDLASPGALSFWVSPRGWRAAAGASGYVRFVRVGGRGRGSFVVQRDVRRRAGEQLVVGFFDLHGGERHFVQPVVGPRWEPGSWHLLVVAWDTDGVAVSVDGAPFVRESVPRGRIAAEFGAPGAADAFVVGDRTQESFLLDDLAVYTRPLREADVGKLWVGGRRGVESP